jgi:hypothetical protein
MQAAMREQTSREVCALVASWARLVRNQLYEVTTKEAGFEVLGEVIEESQVLPAVEFTEPVCLILLLRSQRADRASAKKFAPEGRGGGSSRL